MRKNDMFTDSICVFLYDEEKIENKGGEKCCYFLLFERGKLSWRRKPRNGVLQSDLHFSRIQQSKLV